MEELDWAQPTFFPGAVAAITPDKPAVIMAGSGEQLTYRELDDFANRMSQALRAAGLEAGDSFAFCMENRLEYLAVAWGAHYAGLRYTALSSRLTSEEVTYIVNDCGAKGLLASPSKADVATGIVGDTPQVSVRWSVGGHIDGHDPLDTVIAAHPAEPLPNRRETKDMLYSSGTTGQPKGVVSPDIDAPLGTAGGSMGMSTQFFGLARDAVYLSPAPLYHTAPLRFSLSVHRLGGTAVIMESFDPAQALEAIERYSVTTSQWVPTMFVRMLKLEPELRNRYDLSSLKVAVHAAAPCPIAVKEQMIDWWGPVLHEYYAGTEGNGFCYTNSHDWLDHKGTVGRPILGNVHIGDEEGNEVATGEEGTIYFSGGPPFEYHNDPEKTAAARLANGWSTLGDVGRVDEDGFLYLTDRKAFMIISGGVNIYPQEAENLLVMHPEVTDVAVIGVPDDDFGEQVKAVVTPVTMPSSDEQAAELSARLIAYCREHLADVKCPRTVDFREELPRHQTGKLYKRLLRDEYWAGRDSRIV